jgi:hypothetical protein
MRLSSLGQLMRRTHLASVSASLASRHSTYCMPASGGDGHGRAPELSGRVEAADTLDINGRAAGNAAGLWSRDGNGRAPELSGIVNAAGALDINGGVEGHDCHVRPTRPLGHSTHYTLASGGDGETRIMVLLLWQERLSHHYPACQ